MVGHGNIFGANVGTDLSRTVSGIPTNGSTVYVQLWTMSGGTWLGPNRYTYTAAAIANVTALSPDSATAGGPAFTLTVNGTGFLNGATARWNGSPLTTTFVSTAQLQAAVPATLITTAGAASLTVVNPGNSQPSNTATFTINAFAVNNPMIQATTQACSVRGTVSGVSPASAFAVVVYAYANQYYVQSCDTDPPSAIAGSGSWGPIDSHNGTIYAVLVRHGYQPGAVLQSLPVIDGLNVFAVSPAAGTLSSCDVARCPAQ